MKFTPLAVIALFLAAACGGNKDTNANNPNGSPPTTTDTSAGQMSPSTNPSTTPAPSTQPATPPSTADTTSHMTPPPDTGMKKSTKKHHKAGSDTTMH